MSVPSKESAEQAPISQWQLLWGNLPLSKWRFKKVPLDTITTRFLMVFIFLLAVPVVSVVLFTFFLLKSESTASAHQQIRIIHDAFFSQLTQNEIQSKLLAEYIGERDCNKLSTSTYPFYRCLKIQPLPLTPEYRLIDRHLWYVVPLLNHKSILAYPIDANYIHHFYQTLPSAVGDMAIIPYGKSGNTDNVVGVSLFTSGLIKLQANSWMTSPWLEQQIQSTALETTLGNDKSFWLLRETIYGKDSQRLMHVVFWVPSVLGVKFQQYYWGLYIIAVLSVLLAAVFAMGAGRPITQPLLKLIAQMNAIHHGNLNSNKHQMVTVQGVHEINQLASAFNELLYRLRLAYAMRDEFVATITHDLKVPMLAEKQTLNYMLKETYGPITQEQSDVLQVLATTNEESLKLVNGLLEVYRYEAGGVRLNLDSVDIQKLLQETMTTLRPLVEAKQIKLELKSAFTLTEPVLAYCDALEIKRVLHNLISNAITNTPSHGSIQCRLESWETLGKILLYRLSHLEQSTLSHPVILKGRLLISIQDSGIGFSTEDLPHLFQQFSAAKGRNPMSTGLGLFNCHQVVTAHNGLLWVETTEGEGSAVNFILPQNNDAYMDRRKTDRRANRYNGSTSSSGEIES